MAIMGLAGFLGTTVFVLYIAYFSTLVYLYQRSGKGQEYPCSVYSNWTAATLLSGALNIPGVLYFMKLVQKWLANAIRINQVGNRQIFKALAGFCYASFTFVGAYALLVL